MKKALLAIPALVVLAACGSAVTHSLSYSSIKQVSVGTGIQVGTGTKAADVSDIPNRPNPPISHGQGVNPKSATVTAHTNAPAATSVQPASTGFDRCGPGGPTGPENRAIPGGGLKHPPLPECAVQ